MAAGYKCVALLVFALVGCSMAANLAVAKQGVLYKGNSDASPSDSLLDKPGADAQEELEEMKKRSISISKQSGTIDSLKNAADSAHQAASVLATKATTLKERLGAAAHRRVELEHAAVQAKSSLSHKIHREVLKAREMKKLELSEAVLAAMKAKRSAVTQLSSLQSQLLAAHQQGNKGAAAALKGPLEAARAARTRTVLALMTAKQKLSEASTPLLPGATVNPEEVAGSPAVVRARLATLRASHMAAHARAEEEALGQLHSLASAKAEEGKRGAGAASEAAEGAERRASAMARAAAASDAVAILGHTLRAGDPQPPSVEQALHRGRQVEEEHRANAEAEGSGGGALPAAPRDPLLAEVLQVLRNHSSLDIKMPQLPTIPPFVSNATQGADQRALAAASAALSNAESSAARAIGRTAPRPAAAAPAAVSAADASNASTGTNGNAASAAAAAGGRARFAASDASVGEVPSSQPTATPAAAAAAASPAVGAKADPALSALQNQLVSAAAAAGNAVRASAAAAGPNGSGSGSGSGAIDTGSGSDSGSGGGGSGGDSGSEGEVSSQLPRSALSMEGVKLMEQQNAEKLKETRARLVTLVRAEDSARSAADKATQTAKDGSDIALKLQMHAEEAVQLARLAERQRMDAQAAADDLALTSGKLLQRLQRKEEEGSEAATGSGSGSGSGAGGEAAEGGATGAQQQQQQQQQTPELHVVEVAHPVVVCEHHLAPPCPKQQPQQQTQPLSLPASISAAALQKLEGSLLNAAQQSTQALQLKEQQASGTAAAAAATSASSVMQAAAAAAPAATAAGLPRFRAAAASLRQSRTRAPTAVAGSATAAAAALSAGMTVGGAPLIGVTQTAPPMVSHIGSNTSAAYAQEREKIAAARREAAAASLHADDALQQLRRVAATARGVRAGCSAVATCGECTTTVGCGWCNQGTTRGCVGGDSTGPLRAGQTGMCSRYEFRPERCHCLNGIRDEGEDGVDCGEACGSPCLHTVGRTVYVGDH